VIADNASTVPTTEEPTLKVAALPTRQYTSHALALFVSTIEVYVFIKSVVSIWKMYTPAPDRVKTVFGATTSEPVVLYRPGVKVRPPMFTAPPPRPIIPSTRREAAV
jgi:hypothetical protein